MTALPTDRDIAAFRVLVANRLGLHFDDTRLGLLGDVLRSRVATIGGDYSTYLDGVLRGHGLSRDLDMLARELTVTETFFFRGSDQLAAFTGCALPNRLNACGDRRTARILSAGCASGEEPYSLAIAVREALPHAASRVAITAFDINPAMLEKASQARYSTWALREASTQHKARWFRQDGNAFVINPAIREAVEFQQRNLAQDDSRFWQPNQFDIVFCRNVLMYFTLEQARAAVERLAHSLVPGGYLFLGHAETLRGLSNDFHLCHTNNTFYYQRKNGVGTTEALPLQIATWQPPVASVDTDWVGIIQRSTERIHELVPALSPQEPASTPSASLDLSGVLIHLQAERFDRVLDQLEALPAAQSVRPDVLLLKAISLSQSAKPEIAQAACMAVLDRDELNAGAHYLLALCQERVGDLQGAVEHNEAAVHLDPGFAMPRLHLGLLARRRGDHAVAQHELQLAISLLQQEDPARLLLFGGGFPREALVAMCRAEYAACAEYLLRGDIQC